MNKTASHAADDRRALTDFILGAAQVGSHRVALLALLLVQSCRRLGDELCCLVERRIARWRFCTGPIETLLLLLLLLLLLPLCTAQVRETARDGF